MVGLTVEVRSVSAPPHRITSLSCCPLWLSIQCS